MIALADNEWPVSWAIRETAPTTNLWDKESVSIIFGAGGILRDTVGERVLKDPDAKSTQ